MPNNGSKRKHTHKWIPKKLYSLKNIGTKKRTIYVCTVQCTKCSKSTIIPRQYVKELTTDFMILA